jgi:hypothetical protein
MMMEMMSGKQINLLQKISFFASGSDPFGPFPYARAAL